MMAVKVCKTGEDEVFDNCVAPQAPVEDPDEVAEYKAANPTTETEASREYGNAAMEFVNENDVRN